MSVVSSILFNQSSLRLIGQIFGMSLSGKGELKSHITNLLEKFSPKKLPQSHLQGRNEEVYYFKVTLYF